MKRIAIAIAALLIATPSLAKQVTLRKATPACSTLDKLSGLMKTIQSEVAQYPAGDDRRAYAFLGAVMAHECDFLIPGSQVRIVESVEAVGAVQVVTPSGVTWWTLKSFTDASRD
jgi:hypothetical protein